MTNPATKLLATALSLPLDEVARDLSGGRLNDAVKALANDDLSETATALKQTRVKLEGRGDYELAACADLIRDRCMDELQMRASKN